MDRWPIYRLCLELHVFPIYVNMPYRVEFIFTMGYALMTAIIVNPALGNKSIFFYNYY